MPNRVVIEIRRRAVPLILASHQALEPGGVDGDGSSQFTVARVRLKKLGDVQVFSALRLSQSAPLAKSPRDSPDRFR